MQIYIVETETGSCEQGRAMLFDSAWSSYKAAKEYCKKFDDQSWHYDIIAYSLDSGN